MKTSDPLRGRARRIVRGLAELYPDARCALDHDGPLQLLVATILSAQCTDKRVNLVTPALFARYRTARDYAAADPRYAEFAAPSACLPPARRPGWRRRRASTASRHPRCGTRSSPGTRRRCRW